MAQEYLIDLESDKAWDEYDKYQAYLKFAAKQRVERGIAGIALLPYDFKPEMSDLPPNYDSE